jgi:hypothetical protein
MSTAAPCKRVLPGLALLHPQRGEIEFLRGVIVSTDWGMTGPTTQTVKTESRSAGTDGYIKLITGTTYIFWCDHCKNTIFDQDILNILGMGRSQKATGQICPLCYAQEDLRVPIFPCQPGTKVRVHYRVGKDMSWGGWWAERWGD